MTVFDSLVGQPHVVDALSSAVVGAQDSLDGGPGHGMTHAWLFTGPPGSGRSTAARAFSAALQCSSGGCGVCPECHTALIGTHADVRIITTELLSIGVQEARGLVLESSARPSRGRWRVLLIEDADRLTPEANNALLKVLEEPPPNTVWLLCAPSVDDLLPTIYSRVRHVSLVTPSTRAVAEHLVRSAGVAPEMAAFAARASQGHIGRARGLATDEPSRLRRAEVLRIPLVLHDLGEAMAAAQNLVDAATEDAEDRTGERDPQERTALARALGVENPNRVPHWAAPQFKALKEMQAKRAKRAVRDSLDRMLLDLTSFYRDVLAEQVGAKVELVNAELAGDVGRVARGGTPDATMRRLEAIQLARLRVGSVRDETGQARSGAPLLVTEAMMVTLSQG
ncbi:MAG: DNA polymerase III subunit delta' [Actinomycetes bacterium]